MKFLWVLLLSVLAFGCATNQPVVRFSGYQRHAMAPSGTYMDQVMLVHVDKDFKPDAKQAIRDALEEWSFALNGYMSFLVVQENFTMAQDDVIEKVRLGEVLLFLQRPEETLPMDLHRRALAWVPDVGAKLINVVSARIGTRNLKMILMHEIGHALGLEHTKASGTLMSGYYEDQNDCIDKYTLVTLSGTRYGRAAHWNWRNMNYCDRP